MEFFFESSQGKALKELSETLWSHGYKVFLAGGCVRDFLLGRAYKDLDVVTDAPVEVVQKLFKKTIPVGIQFGIVRVIVQGFEFEVARFRRDGPYKDGRHPEFVEFSEPEADAARRDFTINALFYDLKNQKILDYVGGQADLRQGLLRAVGDPWCRFKEDYLRILRLMRFACQLKNDQLRFQMEEETEKAAMALVAHLKEVSGERICVELFKALNANPSYAIEILWRWNVDLLWISPPYQDRRALDQILSYSGEDSVGWVLSHFMVNSCSSITQNSIDLQSATEWSFNKNYLEVVNSLTSLLKLSRKDEKIFKWMGTLPAWSLHWNSLRSGFRAYLAQTPEFQYLIMAAEQTQSWPNSIINEAKVWMAKPQLQVMIKGEELNPISPSRRGFILRECLFLQYEGVIESREQALAWLQTQINH